MTISLQFPLEVEDGWPPVGSESLPFEKVENGVRALTAPLFVKNLSVDDIVLAEIDDDGFVTSWEIIQQSDHSTVWILRVAETHQIDECLRKARALGCNTVGSDDLGSYAIDVPGDVPIAAIDAVLEELDPEAAAVAFPSLRHPD